LNWQRPAFGRTLFGKSGKPQPTDPIQGQLNNSYLIAVLTTLPKNPKILPSIFLSKNTATSKGYHSLALRKNGVFTEVVIDTFLPSSADNSQICSSSPENNSLWPLLLEKAYAKLYGCYANIGVEGPTGNAFSDIVGAPYEKFDVKPNFENFKIIEQKACQF
jgi:hypothetical protein